MNEIIQDFTRQETQLAVLLSNYCLIHPEESCKSCLNKFVAVT